MHKVIPYEQFDFRDRILGNIHPVIDLACRQEWDTTLCRVLTWIVDDLDENAEEWATLLSKKKS